MQADTYDPTPALTPPNPQILGRLLCTWPPGAAAAAAAAGFVFVASAAAVSSSEYSSSLSDGGIMPAVAGCPTAVSQERNVFCVSKLSGAAPIGVQLVGSEW